MKPKSLELLQSRLSKLSEDVCSVTFLDHSLLSNFGRSSGASSFPTTWRNGSSAFPILIADNGVPACPGLPLPGEIIIVATWRRSQHCSACLVQLRPSLRTRLFRACQI